MDKADDYRSTSKTETPPKRIDKTIQWLASSRDSWKEKTKENKTKLKIATLALKRSREAQDQLKEKLKEERQQIQNQLKQKDDEIAELKKQLEKSEQEKEEYKKKVIAPATGKPKGHTYWNSFMTIAISFLHIASLSFSGTANALNVLHDLGNLEKVPHKETCIRWDMKLGLYKLTRPKETASDWIWIMDHVVTKGVHKCLLVVGVRMSRLEQKNNLTLQLEDLEPLGVVPMKVSNGALVEAELESIMQANGGIPPMAIIKDQGSDLRCGGQKFCEVHPEVINVNDVPHKIACLYKKILENDVDWVRFTKACADFKQKVQLTQISHLAPPNQRAKARYLNIDVLVDWATKWLPYVNSYEELKWLNEYSGRLEEWSQLVETGRIVRDFVRKEGLSCDSYNLVADQLTKVAILPQADEFAQDLIDFLEEEGEKVPKGKRVIGSTEILESLFGVHKAVSDKGPKPMGRLVLTMASRVGEKPSEGLIAKAFEKIKETTIFQWITKAFSKGHKEQVDFVHENIVEEDVIEELVLEEKWNQNFEIA